MLYLSDYNTTCSSNRDPFKKETPEQGTPSLPFQLLRIHQHREILGDGLINCSVGLHQIGPKYWVCKSKEDIIVGKINYQEMCHFFLEGGTKGVRDGTMIGHLNPLQISQLTN